MRAEGVAQVVEHLPSKHKSLSSKPSTSKTQQKPLQEEYFHDLD
jgi:hypothetical protein